MSETFHGARAGLLLQSCSKGYSRPATCKERKAKKTPHLGAVDKDQKDRGAGCGEGKGVEREIERDHHATRWGNAWPALGITAIPGRHLHLRMCALSED